MASADEDVVDNERDGVDEYMMRARAVIFLTPLCVNFDSTHELWV